ncbi:MAG: replication-associated recombination protein A [bacterium]|nr:replication-associated recombination protein A [bacterium]MDN5835622.1 replication-associated recombination protein A [bacterium]
MTRVPLAEQMRPTKLSEVIGHSSLLGENELLYKITKNKQPVSLVLWGPPGTGKTTLARIIANETGADFVEISAVIAKKKDVEQVIERAKQNWNLEIRTILFIDEIHRFNKAQQDAFLPHVESGLITLIGATTENPSFEVISPLLSRTRVVTLQKLNDDDIAKIIKHALKKINKTKNVSGEAIDYLAHLSGGDARVALGNLEIALQMDQKVTPETVKIAASKKVPVYDKNGDMHYNIISAFIKSMRGGDVEATLYYLSRMIDAGEDPKFIARRMIIFASEDVGLEGNGALSLAVAAFQAVERVGLPEAAYNLYHCATALARSNKSREVTDLMHSAQALAQKYPDAAVPLHIRNAPTKLMKDLDYGKDYEWKAGYKPGKGFLPDEISNS